MRRIIESLSQHPEFATSVKRTNSSNERRLKNNPPDLRYMAMKLNRAVQYSSCISYTSLNLLPQNVSSAACSLLHLRNGNSTSKTDAMVAFPSIITNHQHQMLNIRNHQHPYTILMSSSARLYSTTSISMAIGRRRRQHVSGGLGGEDDELTTKTDPAPTKTTSMDVTIEPKLFLSLSTSLFDTVHQAMVPLVPINETLILTRGESSRVMHEEQEKREYEERKRAKREMKEKIKDNAGKKHGIGRNNSNDDDEDPEPISVQSIGDHRIIDGPYLKIELGPMHGQYTFVADVELNRVLFQSPISGQLIYFYDLNNTNEWINVHDQHNLLGMFVRDIIRQIQGVPKI